MMRELSDDQFLGWLALGPVALIAGCLAIGGGIWWGVCSLGVGLILWTIGACEYSRRRRGPLGVWRYLFWGGPP